MKTLKQKLNKIFKDNPDFIFYDFENECVGKDLLDLISNLLQKQREDIVKLEKLSNKYAEVIAMVYDGEDVEKAEKIVGLR